MASGDGPPSPKRAKLDLEGATFVYDPKELADFCLETADGKRIGVHRAYILRHSAFFNKLLEACPADKVAVAETADEIRGLFLDVLYDPDTEVRPADALRVLGLADKYEAQRLMRACERVLCSEGFKLTVWKPNSPGSIKIGSGETIEFEAEEGHCWVLEALQLASKHGFQDLYTKCRRFVMSHQGGKLVHLLCTDFCKGKLAQLKPEHLAGLITAMALGQAAVKKKMRDREAALLEEKSKWGKERAELEKKAQGKHKQYENLLRKYNKLINKNSHKPGPT